MIDYFSIYTVVAAMSIGMLLGIGLGIWLTRG